MSRAAPTDWRVYDRPELLETVSFERRDGLREALVALEALHCAACVARLEKRLAGQVRALSVNLPARVVEFAWDPRAVPLSRILNTLDEAGFAPRVLAQVQDARAAIAERRAAVSRIGVAALCGMQVMMLAWRSYFVGGGDGSALDDLLRWAQWVLATPAVLYAGWPFFRGAARAFSERALNMDVPVALALAIAYLASAWRTVSGHGEIYFDSATMFVLFLSVGRFLEGRTRARAAERLRLLAESQPLSARRRTPAGGVEEVPIGRLAVGDEILVAPGEAVPVDGVLMADPAELDEALVTGESRPVRRAPGERALAGSLNAGARPLTLRVEAVGGATTLSQLARLLARAQGERPRFQQLADRLAGHFILAVLVLAALGAWFAWRHGPDAALSVALAVMVASCPCALSLAVPTAFAAASSRLAAAGVLVARPEALGRLPHIDTVLFDKTGTLTHTELTVRRIEALGDEPAGRCWELAAALENGFHHPIARALSKRGTTVVACAVRNDAQGVAGIVGGREYRLCAPEQLADLPAPARAILASSGAAACTWVVLAQGQGALALFGLAAAPRPEAAAVIDDLTARGLKPELLTGDAEPAARRLAHEVGIACVRARQTPADKLAYLQALQREGRRVLAVGDGLNDAPFLAAADVAVAMPQGAALAQARADVILTGGSLAGLPQLLDTARLALSRMRENLAWALLYNLAVLPLAMGGWLKPWMAALGMSLSSLLVVANALRLPAARRSRTGRGAVESLESRHATELG